MTRYYQPILQVLMLAAFSFVALQGSCIADDATAAEIQSPGQFDLLQLQIDQLRAEFDAAAKDQLPSPVTQPTSLEEDLEGLVKWREKMDQDAAKAKEKAAGSPTLKLNGRVFLDTAVFDQNAASVIQMGNAQNGTEARTVRVEFSGMGFGVYNYALHFDVGGQTTIQDMFVGMSDLPLLQNVRIGHFKEPFGMERMTSGKHITFMERSTNDGGVFVPVRNMGVMAFTDNADQNYTFAIGAFASEQGDQPPIFQDDNSATAVTTRFTWLPWYDEATEGRGLLHFGSAYSYRDLANDDIRLRARPDSHLAPYAVDTGTVAASDMQLIGAEAAYAYGSFIAQAEYFGSTINTVAPGTPYLDGFYVQTSYFLTGEYRPYNRRGGAFNNRIIPHENFFRVRTGDGSLCCGLGAWETAYRFSRTNLDDGTIAGGAIDDHQVGLNWYMSPFARTMFDYIHSTTDRGGLDDGVAHIFQMRLQFDW